LTQVTLPALVKPDSVEAALEDGLVRLKLYKGDVHKPRPIEIASS
jgi:HSP20 family molecular chaperone IbpA